MKQGFVPTGTADFTAGDNPGLFQLSVGTGVFSLLGAAGAAHKSALSSSRVTEVPGREFFSPVLVLV